MYSVNLVLELSLSFTKIGLADQFLEITLPCWKSSLRGRSRRFEKESPRSISWRKKGCCAIGRGGVKVVSAIGRRRVKGVSASELLPCRCLIKMPSKADTGSELLTGCWQDVKKYNSWYLTSPVNLQTVKLNVVSGVPIGRQMLYWSVWNLVSWIYFESPSKLFCMNMMRYSAWKILFICKLGT